MRTKSAMLWGVCVGVGLAGGCSGAGGRGADGPTPPATTQPVATAPAAPARDVCENDKPLPHPFHGVLAQARCDQEMFLTMASVAGSLGVECKHCHAAHPTDPNLEDYPKPTPKKDVANFMRMHLMTAIKPADGSPLRCKSCHVDPVTGKPVAKILGNPRDVGRAIEWMNLVMVNRFVAADGAKLKCRSCHLGNFGTPEFKPRVILHGEQLPPHVVP